VLEIVRRHLCSHVTILPEAASIAFGGGFPRTHGIAGRRAAQRAIFHIQRELESMAIDEGESALILCDRGGLDGVAYWPLDEASFFADLGCTREVELARYAAVIHLRPPAASNGYDHRNPLRTESASEAAAIDVRIERAWAGHPRRAFVDSTPDFLTKAARAIALIRELVPACCCPVAARRAG
jgi:hypothetical protein